MAIFLFSKWRPSAILRFKKFEILVADGVERSVHITKPNFMAISQTIEHTAIFQFSKWRLSAMLDF